MRRGATVRELRIKTVGRGRLADGLVEQMTELISSGDVRPGDALPSEVELAERFAVSKPVLREALQRLADMGVVEIRHGKPTIVRSQGSRPLAQYFEFAVRVSADRLRDVLGLRRAIETHTVGLAATLITDEELVELRRIVGVLSENRHNPEVWTPANAEFHMLLVRASRNVLIINLFEALAGPIEASMRLLHAQRHVRDPDGTFQRHLAILEAVEAHDPVAAVEAMHEHFAVNEPAIAAALAAEARTHLKKAE
jgi:GntR family transcriptional repressor for pyruvate dehydrogenase complex